MSLQQQGRVGMLRAGFRYTTPPEASDFSIHKGMGNQRALTSWPTCETEGVRSVMEQRTILGGKRMKALSGNASLQLQEDIAGTQW